MSGVIMKKIQKELDEFVSLAEVKDFDHHGKVGLMLHIHIRNITTTAPWKESYEKPRQHIKKQGHHFADKGPYSQLYGFSSSHVRI